MALFTIQSTVPKSSNKLSIPSVSGLKMSKKNSSPGICLPLIRASDCLKDFEEDFGELPQLLPRCDDGDNVEEVGTVAEGEDLVDWEDLNEFSDGILDELNLEDWLVSLEDKEASEGVVPPGGQLY